MQISAESTYCAISAATASASSFVWNRPAMIRAIELELTAVWALEDALLKAPSVLFDLSECDGVLPRGVVSM